MSTWKQYKEFVTHHERLQKPVSRIAFATNKGCANLSQVKDETSKETSGGRVPSDGCNSELGFNTNDHDAKNTTGSQLGKDLDENVHDHRAATEEASDFRKSQQSLLSSRTKSPTLAKDDFSQGHDIGIESPNPNQTPSSDTRGTPDPRGQPKEKDKDLGKKKPAGPNEPFEQWERDEMEALLKEVQGHLGESPLGIPNNGSLIVPTSCLPDTILGGRRYRR